MTCTSLNTAGSASPEQWHAARGSLCRAIAEELFAARQRLRRRAAQESLHYFKYKAAENVLYEFADDVAPRHITAALPLDYDTVAAADKFCNVFLTRLPAEVSGQARRRLSTTRSLTQSATDFSRSYLSLPLKDLTWRALPRGCKRALAARVWRQRLPVPSRSGRGVHARARPAASAAALDGSERRACRPSQATIVVLSDMVRSA